MAKYDVGVLGNFEGKVGTVVGSKWNGINYMRSKGRKSKIPPTQSQLEQRARFAVVGKFVQSIADLLMNCYPNKTGRNSINQAFTDIYASALTGTYPAYGLDYSKVLISKGKLLNAKTPAAQAAGGGIIKFTWTDNTDHEHANANDRSVLLVYCPEMKLSYSTTTGAQRSAGAGSLDVSNLIGKVVETWVSFLSANGNIAAQSIFTGQLTVT